MGAVSEHLGGQRYRSAAHSASRADPWNGLDDGNSTSSHRAGGCHLSRIGPGQTSLGPTSNHCIYVKTQQMQSGRRNQVDPGRPNPYNACFASRHQRARRASLNSGKGGRPGGSVKAHLYCPSAIGSSLLRDGGAAPSLRPTPRAGLRPRGFTHCSLPTPRSCSAKIPSRPR